MSQSIRFLGLAIFAWAGVRAISLGIIPGADALAVEPSAFEGRAPVPGIVPTVLPPIEPLSPGGAQQAGMPLAELQYYPAGAAYTGPFPYPIYIPVSAGPGHNSPPQIIYANAPPTEPRDIQLQREAIANGAPPLDLSFKPTMQATPSFERPRWLPKRLSVSSWAMVRNQGGPDSLAGQGMLGGSEAGARLTWQLAQGIYANLRTSAPVNSQRGAEAALGIRYQPLPSLPVSVTLERRHAIGAYGRNAFALFAEGGVYGRPMPWQTTLDGYFQGGVVDFNNPDWFVDGQVAISRPLWRNLSGGFGAWGGAQPGLNRLDVGPRLSLRLGQRMRAHVDYRLNLAGNAAPGSGAVVTLAGDF